MWRRNAFVLGLALAQGVVASGMGQERPPSSLVSQSDWVRFEFVLGRITALNLRYGQSRCEKTSGPHDEVRESLSLNGDSDLPSLRYELVDSRQALTIDVDNGNQVNIRREPRGESPAVLVQFRQEANGDLALSVGAGQSQREFAAPSLWHLMLAEPQACRLELVPILELLRPDWQLLETTKGIEDALFEIARTGQTAPRKRVSVLVAALDRKDFKQRRAADEELRSMGLPVLSYLSRLDHRALSGEQRLRIRRIREDLIGLTPDTAERVATWLMDDKTVWLALLSHEQPSKRAAAANRLAGIHSTAIQFDPFAEESLRRQQIAQLRSQLSQR